VARQLYVVRHCSATGQSENAQLSMEGQEQAERLADFLRDREIESIVTSPYVRAQCSIEPLARQLNLRIQVDCRLSERVLSANNLDDWMECLRLTFMDFDLAYDGGETSRAAMSRAVQVVYDVLSGNHERVALVTHGNLMTLLLKHFDERFGFQEWSQLTNPDIFLITVSGSESRVERIWR
jgi:2,3-bisphosphoglycerate-dependent phosphoglycerate mutase